VAVVAGSVVASMRGIRSRPNLTVRQFCPLSYRMFGKPSVAGARILLALDVAQRCQGSRTHSNGNLFSRDVRSAVCRASQTRTYGALLKKPS
jgi:hypothetical protein